MDAPWRMSTTSLIYLVGFLCHILRRAAGRDREPQWVISISLDGTAMVSTLYAACQQVLESGARVFSLVA